MSDQGVSPLDELRALRADLVAMEPGPRFMGLPDRWCEAPGPRFRCTSGHVSTCILESEEHGDQCLACYAPVVLTFPEDFDDPKAVLP